MTGKTDILGILNRKTPTQKMLQEFFVSDPVNYTNFLTGSKVFFIYLYIHLHKLLYLMFCIVYAFRMKLRFE